MEAMCAGAPVIAFRGGGALETLTDKAAIFFDEPTVDSLIAALRRFEHEPNNIQESDARVRGAVFSKQEFQRQFRDVIDGLAREGKFF